MRLRDSSPVTRFLGADAGRGGPFTLLGLKHDIDSDVEIHRARLRRLRQIDCHPQRSTPDADEVRLAIHSAATQLLDPTLREQLAIRWPEGTPVDVPKAWGASSALRRITPKLARRAMLIVGSSGGWNTTARRRLAHLAKMNRVSAIEMVQELGGKRHQTQKSSPDDQSSLPELPEEPSGGSGWGFAYLCVAMLACATTIGIFADVSRRGQQSSLPEVSTSDDAPRTSFGGETNPFSALRTELRHYTAIAHELDRLVAQAKQNQSVAMDRFQVVYPEFVQDWRSFPRAALQRAGQNIVEFVLRLEEASVPPEQVASYLSMAGVHPERVLIGAGIIDFVLSSNALRPETREHLLEIRYRLCTTPTNQSQELGELIAQLAPMLATEVATDDPLWWDQWIQSVEHVTDPGAMRSTHILRGASPRLSEQTPPSSDWRATASLIVQALEWRENSPERFWLIEQFSNERVTTPRLAMLTEALVTESAAQGVTQLMVLDRDANDPARERMLVRYREAWFPNRRGANNASSGESSQLLNQLRVEINATPERITDAQAISSLLRLTRLNIAAKLQLDGYPVLAEEVLAAYDDPIDTGDSRTAIIIQTPDDNEWAERAVNAQSAASLRPHLDELIGKRTIGISSAHALVYIATDRRRERESRDLATQRIISFADQLPMLIAIDHVLSASPTRWVDELVTQVLKIDLPSRNSDAWLPAVRKELLARMGNALDSDMSLRLRELQSELMGIHALRSQALGIDLRPDTRLHEIHAKLNEHDAMHLSSLPTASSVTSSQIAQARSVVLVSRSRATSSMHMYLAEQQFNLDLLLLRARTEYPEAEQVFLEIARTHRSSAATSTSILQQIMHTERAASTVLRYLLERSPSP